MKAVLLKRYGLNDLRCVDVPAPSNMTKKDLYIQHTVIPVSMDDIKFVSGQFAPYRVDNDLSGSDIVGFAGIGKVLKIGSGVSGFNVGQRVAYPFGGLGSYCEKRVINSSFCFPVPDVITDVQMASIIRDGLSALTLIQQVVNLRVGNVILVHDISNPVSQILCKIATMFKLKIVASIMQESHRQTALNCGAELVLHYKAADFSSAVRRFTGNFGVSVVYDVIGQEVFNSSIESLRIFGIYVQCYGSRGNLSTLVVEKMAEKSLFFSAPMLEHYKSDRESIALSLKTLTDLIIKGSLKPNITSYKLSDIHRAYRDVVSCKVSGSVVLIP